MFRQVENAFQFQRDNADEIEHDLFINEDHDCVVYRLPTGGGKTLVAGEIIERAIHKHGHNTLFITHRDSILQQTYDLFKNAGYDAGKVVAGGAWQKHKKLNIGMDKSFTNRMQGQENSLPKFLVIDEAHHVKGGKKPTGMGRIADAVLENGGKVLKLTATPVRLDGQGLGLGYGGFATKMVHGPCGRELIEMGRIMDPILLGVPADQIPDMKGVSKTAGDFTAKAVDAALAKSFVYGNAVQHYQECIDTYGFAPGIVFTRSEVSANAAADAFNESGYLCDVLTQQSAKTKEVRDKMIYRLKNGLIAMISTVDIVSEGFDLPDIGIGIMERPTESITVFLQQLGRILRYLPNKARPILLDAVGNCWRHRNVLMQEFYGDGYDWRLDGKVQADKEDDYEPRLTIKRCKNTQCNIVSPGHAKTCECGADFPAIFRKEPKKLKGRLEEINLHDVPSPEEERLRSVAVRILKEKRNKTLKDYHAYSKLTNTSGLSPKKVSERAYAMYNKNRR